MAEFYYRYWDPMYEDGDIYLQSYEVARRTPKGVWLHEYQGSEELKFVLDGVGKRFAYPTVEMARTNYLKRKERAISILNARLREQEEYLRRAQRGEWAPKFELFSLPVCSCQGPDCRCGARDLDAG